MGTTMPLVSVVVPVWNPGSELLSCLASIQSQSYRNLEVLCVDDGSTDGSAATIADICARDVRFKHLSTHGRTGPGVARNIGLDVARGRFVAFVDADDRLAAFAIERLVTLALRTGSELVRGSLVVEYEDGPDSVGEPWQSVSDVDQRAYRDVALDMLPHGFTAYLYCRDMLERHSIRFDDLMFGEDPPFLIRCLISANHISSISSVVYFYNQVERSTFGTPTHLRQLCIYPGLIRNDLVNCGLEEVWTQHLGPYFSEGILWQFDRMPDLRGRLQMARSTRSSLVVEGRRVPGWASWSKILYAAVILPGLRRAPAVFRRISRRLRRAPYRAYRALPLPVREAYRRVRGRTEPVTSDD